MFDIDVTFEAEGFTLDLTLESAPPRFAVTGPSGSGKTTVLRIVAGLEQGADGRVAVDGRIWQDRDGTWIPPWERGVGWLPQEALVFPHLDARGNLEYAEPPADLVSDVVEALELEDRLEASADTLSGGESQRVALGRALLAEPDVLLLDEPFSALDERLTGRVVDFLNDWCDDYDCGLLIAAHDETTAAPLVKDHTTLHDGQVVDP